MPACDFCGSHILFGGVRDGELRFCGDECAGQLFWIRKAETIPKGEIEQRLGRVHRGTCPKCAGGGPVDLHTSHWVYSAIAFTRWGSRREVCCRGCARMNHLKDGMFSALLGWWGFPAGLILTPIQVGRAFFGLLGASGPRDDEPSPALRRLIAVRMAADCDETWRPGGR